MSAISLEQKKESQVGNFRKWESYESEQSKKDQLDEKDNSSVIGKSESYKSEQNKEDPPQNSTSTPKIDEFMKETILENRGRSTKDEIIENSWLAELVPGDRVIEKDKLKIFDKEFYETVIQSDIDEICEILESFSDQTRKLRKRYFALDLFSKFNEIGLISPYQDIINSENQTKKRIKELLVLNCDKIRIIFIHFPDILFYDLYDPETVCELRSGIEFFFQFCEDLVYANKKLFDPKECRISIIDQSLKNYLKELKYHNTIIPNNFPKEHWWWQELAKSQADNTNQPTSEDKDLASYN
jgi:hypothetical protein